jgi:glycine/D-amino acid oxidase-like deaminating enzyme
VPDLYDVIVLGAGSTGTNVAWYVRDNGLAVATRHVVDSRRGGLITRETSGRSGGA